MRVVHINTSDQGGAGKACIRLHEAMLQRGVHSSLLTLHKSLPSVPQHAQYRENDPSAARSLPERVWRRLSGSARREAQQRQQTRRQRKELLSTVCRQFEHFSFPDSPYKHLAAHPLVREADVVNLHWVSDFLDYPAFWEALPDKPVVWTLHDMNPFTGGCHYSAGCTRYQTDCHQCPQLTGTALPDQAEAGLALKKRVFAKKTGLRAIVTPSQWLGALSAGSHLFAHVPHYTIPNSLDTQTFRPLPQPACRQVLGLPPDKQVLLFVSSRLSNRRKGFDILLESLRHLPAGHARNIVVCSVGEPEAGADFSGVAHVALGAVQDEMLMRIAYNAADGFVIPSREDNLPNVVLESLACGTPVVGFAVGGIADLVVPGENGLLATRIDSQDFAVALTGFLDRLPAFDRGAIARDAAARYGLSVQADAYHALYRKLLEG
jgi:glycosyltransferase involved in cell wall biosynthesis